MKKADTQSRSRCAPRLPHSAADVFRESVAKIEHGGVSVVIEPFTIRRVALLHTVQSPLFYTCPRFGNGIGWMLSVYIMAYDQDDACSNSRSLGLCGICANSPCVGRWAQDYELCAMCALAIQDGWDRILRPTRPDLMPKGWEPSLGKASGWRWLFSLAGQSRNIRNGNGQIAGVLPPPQFAWMIW